MRIKLVVALAALVVVVSTVLASYLIIQQDRQAHYGLYKGMTYEQVVQQLGQPVDDIGVNIHVYVWESTRIYATFSISDNRLIAAIQVLPDGQLRTLVEP